MDKPSVEPSLSKGVSPLIIAANGSNGAILLTQTFNLYFWFVTVDILGYKMKKTGIEEQSCLLLQS